MLPAELTRPLSTKPYLNYEPSKGITLLLDAYVLQYSLSFTVAMTESNTSSDSIRYRYGRLVQRLKHEVYSPLDPRKREIRLLRIAPSSGSARTAHSLKCTLETVSLDTAPEFDALSYTWHGELQAIHLNGKRFKITRNLYLAMLALRSSDVFQGYLWADAVCINQGDFEERSSQVRLMRTIYSQARTVRVWLGPSHPGIDTMFAQIQLGAAIDRLLDSNNGSSEALRYIISRTWWRRLWVIQEVTLASNVTVHCGEQTIPWKLLLSTLTQLGTANVTGKLSIASMSNLGSYAELLYGIDLTFQDTRQWSSGDAVQVVEALETMSSSLISDPKDYVYGALGLLPPSMEIVPDYNKSRMEVYRDFTLHFMKHFSSLEFLALCKERERDTNVPSWVPDLSVYVAHSRGKSASLVEADFALQDPVEGRLSARGIIVDRIVEIVGAFLADGGLIEDRRPKISAFRRQVYQHLSANHAFASAEVDGSFWYALSEMTARKTVSLNGTAMHLAATEVAPQLDDWLREGHEPASHQARMARWYIERTVNHRVISVTASGRIVGSSSLPRLGDHIGVLASCSVPLVLRPESSRGRNAYSVVSSCDCAGVSF